jgi:uncharacterized membrane protein
MVDCCTATSGLSESAGKGNTALIIATQFIPLWLNLLFGIGMFFCVAGAAWTAPWSALGKATERQHVLLGGLLALLLLWLLSFEVTEGVSIHLLGVTSLTLIVGWRFTLLGGTLVLFAHLLLVQHSMQAAPLAWFFSLMVPATVTRLLAHVLRRHGFRNLFVYMLGAGFGGGLLSMLAAAALTLPVFWLIGQSDWLTAGLENWPFVLLLMFPEGFINGMVITAFTVFYPDVVKTFDDDFYLSE